MSMPSDNDTMRQAAEREELIHALLSELAGIDTHDVNLRDHAEAWLAVEDFERAIVAALASHPAPAEASPEPVAWGAFVFGGKRDGKLYSWCDTKADAEAYVQHIHQASDSVTLRIGPLYASAAPAEGARDDTALDVLQARFEARARGFAGTPGDVAVALFAAWSDASRELSAARGIAGIQATKGDTE